MQRLAASLLAVGVSACLAGPTGVDAFPFAGMWEYDAVQEIPTPSTVAGAMSWAGSGDVAGFEGTAAWTEVLPGGGVRLLNGPLSGLLLQDSIVDFTVQIEGVARRHVGVIRGDSATGTWADGGASTSSGTFIARRSGTL